MNFQPLMRLCSDPFMPPKLNYISRVLLSTIFIVSGVGKLTAIEDTQKYVEAYGVPGSLVCSAAAFEITSGVSILCGLALRCVSTMLAFWCLLTATIFHRDFEDQNQRVHFIKNLAMTEGFLTVAHLGLGNKQWQERDDSGGLSI